jgi:hypothetical protein
MADKEEEVLELGADGCFDIPDALAEVLAPANWYSKSNVCSPNGGDTSTDDNDEAVPEGKCSREDYTITDGPFCRLNGNEYKIIKEREDRINVILCCEEDVGTPRFRLSDKVVLAEINGKQISIDLPVVVKPATATSKFFGRYLVIKVDIDVDRGG